MKNNDLFETLVKEVTHLASATSYLFLTIIFYLIGAEVVAIKLLFGIVIALIIISALRLLLFKDRPVKKKHKGIIQKIAAGTFPSHHSANIGLITVILVNTFHNWLLTPFLLLVSALILLSRVYLKKHFLIDVVVGYIIGLVIGMLLV